MGVFESLAPEYFVYTVLHHFSRRTTFGKMVSRRIRTYFPEIWKSWKSGNLGSNKSKNWKFSKSKSVLPKMSARSGLAGKRTSRPHLGPSRAIFCVGRKNPKNAEMLPIFLGGPLLLSTQGGAIGLCYFYGCIWQFEMTQALWVGSSGHVSHNSQTLLNTFQ